jgi:hypothetical protein
MTPVRAQELGLFEAIKKIPSGTIVTRDDHKRTERRARGRRTATPVTIPTKKRTLKSLIARAEATMLGDTKRCMKA